MTGREELVTLSGAILTGILATYRDAPAFDLSNPAVRARTARLVSLLARDMIAEVDALTGPNPEES